MVSVRISSNNSANDISVGFINYDKIESFSHRDMLYRVVCSITTDVNIIARLYPPVVLNVNWMIERGLRSPRT